MECTVCCEEGQCVLSLLSWKVPPVLSFPLKSALWQQCLTSCPSWLVHSHVMVWDQSGIWDYPGQDGTRSSWCKRGHFSVKRAWRRKSHVFWVVHFCGKFVFLWIKICSCNGILSGTACTSLFHLWLLLPKTRCLLLIFCSIRQGVCGFRNKYSSKCNH